MEELPKLRHFALLYSIKMTIWCVLTLSSYILEEGVRNRTSTLPWKMQRMGQPWQRI